MTARLHALSLLALAACTDPPVTYSVPVGISLHARSADSTNGIVTARGSAATGFADLDARGDLDVTRAFAAFE